MKDEELNKSDKTKSISHPLLMGTRICEEWIDKYNESKLSNKSIDDDSYEKRLRQIRVTKTVKSSFVSLYDRDNNYIINQKINSWTEKYRQNFKEYIDKDITKNKRLWNITKFYRVFRPILYPLLIKLMKKISAENYYKNKLMTEDEKSAQKNKIVDKLMREKYRNDEVMRKKSRDIVVSNLKNMRAIDKMITYNFKYKKLRKYKAAYNTSKRRKEYVNKIENSYAKLNEKIKKIDFLIELTDAQKISDEKKAQRLDRLKTTKQNLLEEKIKMENIDLKNLNNFKKSVLDRFKSNLSRIIKTNNVYNKKLNNEIKNLKESVVYTEYSINKRKIKDKVLNLKSEYKKKSITLQRKEQIRINIEKLLNDLKDRRNRGSTRQLLAEIKFLENKRKNQAVSDKFIKKMETKINEMDFNIKTNKVQDLNNIKEFTTSVNDYLETLKNVSSIIKKRSDNLGMISIDEENIIKEINNCFAHVNSKYKYFNPGVTKAKIKKVLDTIYFEVSKAFGLYKLPQKNNKTVSLKAQPNKIEAFVDKYVEKMFKDYRTYMLDSLISLKNEMPDNMSPKLNKINTNINDLEDFLKAQHDFNFFKNNQNQFLKIFNKINNVILNNKSELSDLSPLKFTKLIESWMNFNARVTCVTNYVNLEREHKTPSVAIKAFSDYMKARHNENLKKFENHLMKVAGLPKKIKNKTQIYLKQKINNTRQSLIDFEQKYTEGKISIFLNSVSRSKFVQVTKNILKEILGLGYTSLTFMLALAKEVVPKIGEVIGKIGGLVLSKIIPYPISSIVPGGISKSVGGQLGKHSFGALLSGLNKIVKSSQGEKYVEDLKSKYVKAQKKVKKYVDNIIYPVSSKLKQAKDPLKEFRDHLIVNLDIMYDVIFSKIGKGEINRKAIIINESLKVLEVSSPEIAKMENFKNLINISKKLSIMKKLKMIDKEMENFNSLYKKIIKSRKIKKKSKESEVINHYFKEITMQLKDVNELIDIRRDFYKNRKGLKSKNPGKFLKSMNNSSQLYDKFNGYIERKINEKKGATLEIENSFKDPELSRQTMLVAAKRLDNAGQKFYQAAKKFTESKSIQDVVTHGSWLHYLSSQESRKNKLNSKDEKFSWLRKWRLGYNDLKMKSLKFICNVNFALVKIVKFGLPLAFSFVGATAGGALGALGDLACLEISLGTITISGAIVGGIIGGVVGDTLATGLGNLLSSSYKWLDKRNKERLVILQKELAINATYDNAKNFVNIWEQKNDMKVSAKVTKNNLSTQKNSSNVTNEKKLIREIKSFKPKPRLS